MDEDTRWRIASPFNDGDRPSHTSLTPLTQRTVDRPGDRGLATPVRRTLYLGNVNVLGPNVEPRERGAGDQHEVEVGVNRHQMKQMTWKAIWRALGPTQLPSTTLLVAEEEEEDEV